METLFKGAVVVSREDALAAVGNWLNMRQEIALREFDIAKEYRKLPWYKRLYTGLDYNKDNWRDSYNKDKLFSCSFGYNNYNGALKELKDLLEVDSEIIYVNPSQAKMINLFK